MTHNHTGQQKAFYVSVGSRESLHSQGVCAVDEIYQVPCKALRFTDFISLHSVPLPLTQYFPEYFFTALDNFRENAPFPKSGTTLRGWRNQR